MLSSCSLFNEHYLSFQCFFYTDRNKRRFVPRAEMFFSETFFNLNPKLHLHSESWFSCWTLMVKSSWDPDERKHSNGVQPVGQRPCCPGPCGSTWAGIRRPQHSALLHSVLCVEARDALPMWQQHGRWNEGSTNKRFVEEVPPCLDEQKNYFLSHHCAGFW